MLIVRNDGNLVQIGDEFANYRLVRSYVLPTSAFSNGGSGGAQLLPDTPPAAAINVAGVDSPLVVIRPINSDHRGSVTMWWGPSGGARLFGKVKNMLYQVEVYIFGKTTRADTVAGPKLLMRNAAGVVNYDSRHIPLVVEDFVTVTASVPNGTNEIDLGQFLPGKGLGACMVGPRTNFHSTTSTVAWADIESIRVTADNHIWLSTIRLWDTVYGAYFQTADFDMTDNPFYLMLVDTNKLPLPYENV